MKLSVVMPVYNERATLREVVARVLSVPLEIELLCVDDGSTDGSREILGELEKQHPQMRVFLQPHNMGKGAALRRGIQQATGDFVIIQDADLEYDPARVSAVLEPLIAGQSRCSFRLALHGRRPASRSLFLAFGRQLVSHPAFQLPHQYQPHRYGDLLQSLSPRNYSIDPDRRKPLRV